MTNVGLRFREMLTGAFEVVQNELDHIIAGIQGTWGIEHKADGTHSRITADRVDVDNLLIDNNAIHFPATHTPSTNPNTLDDYQEGSWTPVLGGQGGTSGQTYSVQFGRYVKIGKFVWAFYSLTLSAKGTITGVVQVQGLPFTSSGTNAQAGAGTTYTANLATNTVDHKFLVSSAVTAATLYMKTAASTGHITMATADIANDTQLIGFIIYESQT